MADSLEAVSAWAARSSVPAPAFERSSAPGTLVSPPPVAPALSAWAPRIDAPSSVARGGSIDAHVSRGASLFAQLPDALAYPLQGPGVFMILGGTIFSWLIALASRVPFLGVSLAIFAAGYLSAYTLKVIESSAHGQRQLPLWPDFADWWEDILCPLFRVLSATFVSFALPGALVAVLVVKGVVGPTAFLLAAVLGLVYFPMALVAIAVRRNFSAASPHIVVRMIVAAPLEYGVACAVVAVLIGVRVVVHVTLAVMLPLLGLLVGDLIAFYLLMVELRVLGLIYHVCRDRLDWLEAA